MAVVRSTVSFNSRNWQKIKNAKNRSETVNTALEYYFTAQHFLKAKEEEFILGELAHYEKTGESYTFGETFADEA